MAINNDYYYYHDVNEIVYGTRQEDGTFNGYVGMVERGELDLVACDFT